MKLSFGHKMEVPSDREIERDVAELRNLLSRIPETPEPHPAYYQNFLVHVHERIDEGRFRRKRWVPSVAWTSISAAAVVVVIAASGLLTTTTQTGNPVAISGNSTQHSSTVNEVVNPPSSDMMGAKAEAIDYDQTPSLVLSTEDVRMLNAVNSGSDDDLLKAVAQTDNLQ